MMKDVLIDLKVSGKIVVDISYLFLFDMKLVMVIGMKVVLVKLKFLLVNVDVMNVDLIMIKMVDVLISDEDGILLVSLMLVKVKIIVKND